MYPSSPLFTPRQQQMCKICKESADSTCLAKPLRYFYAMNEAMRSYLAKIGKLGGQSTSPAKTQAARDNGRRHAGKSLASCHVAGIVKGMMESNNPCCHFGSLIGFQHHWNQALNHGLVEGTDETRVLTEYGRQCYELWNLKSRRGQRSSGWGSSGFPLPPQKLTLASRSPYIAHLEALGELRPANAEPSVESFVELDEQAEMPDYDT